MDTNIARQTLRTAITARTNELDAITLAEQILSDTFSAEFTARDTAVAEADRLAAEKAAEVTAHNETKEQLAERDATITALTEEKAALQDRIDVLVSPDMPL